MLTLGPTSRQGNFFFVYGPTEEPLSYLELRGCRFRTAWVSAILYSAALLLRALSYSDWSWGLDLEKLGQEAADTTAWLGAIAGGVYAALYARFSSQWSYLADVYHQIKDAIVTGPSELTDYQLEQLQYWKAAFVEDAEDLHLVRKRMFAMTAWVWLQDDGVAEKFDAATVGGKARRLKLQKTLIAELRKEDPDFDLRPRGRQ